ncbi:MAG TPA: pitrilysin family protein, partial [Planctomycetota bacterium]|nr:pitrilysin family protein [Planctomycetota bacterium]
HVPEGGHFKLISAAGGTLNGTTSLDRTVYFETLPKNHLELALWLESDRMGFLLPAMTQAKLDNQRDVVMNERRQNYDNRPYGRVTETIAAQLFPEDHPYHWLPIGSMEDIAAATLDDVSAFFRRWYGPNNATLCIAGDVDAERAFELAAKWFAGIERGPSVERAPPRVAKLDSERRAVLEDRVALPQVSLTWAAAPQFTQDAAALTLLSMILSQNKASVLDRALTVESSRARSVSAGHWAAELAGRFDVTVRAAPGVGLSELEDRVRELLFELRARGIDAGQLERMKTRCEADVVRSLQTVVGRAGSLAEYNLFSGDPGHQRVELELLRRVSPDVVSEALQRFLLTQPAVVLECVPLTGVRAAAAATSAARAAVKSVPASAPVEAAAPPEAESERSHAPRSDPSPKPAIPAGWIRTFPSGARAGAASFSRSPWCTVSLALPMGRRAETADLTGISSLAANLFSEGTRRHSTLEFADALDEHGASLSIGAGDDEILYSLSVLDRALQPAIDLLFEAALEPRLDPKDHERMVTQRRTAIATRGENPTAIAGRVWARLMHGDTPLGRSALAAEANLEALSLEAIAEFHHGGAHARGARLSIASPRHGPATDEIAERALARLPKPDARAHQLSNVASDARSLARVFIVDRPGAAQTELRVGQMSVASTHPDYFPLAVLNYALGGAFSSRINLNLREAKGFTYGARSHFAGGVLPGPFTVSAAVETSVTAAAAREVLRELALIREGVRADELAFAQDALRQSLITQYESCDARRALVDNALKYDWPRDYPLARARVLERLTLADLDRLAREFLDPSAWIVLAVGDAKAIGNSLEELGLGPAQALDIDGLSA